MTHDSRRYHRRRPPPLTRAYGQQSSQQTLQYPYGGLSVQTAGAVGRQQIQPLLQGLGLGVGKKAQRLQKQIASGQASGPLGSAIQAIQQFAPQVLPNAQALGQQMSTQGADAVKGLQSAITQAQGQLPKYQQAADKGLSASEQGLAGAQDLYGQAKAALPGLQQIAAQGTQGAQDALGLARGYTSGPAMTAAQAGVQRAQDLLTGGAQTGAQQAMDLASKYAAQAALPTGQEDLYQVAARRVAQQINPQLAARGLESGGAGAQATTDALRDMTYQFAANRAAQQQATAQGLTGAAQGLGGLQQAALSGLGAQTTNLGNLQQQGLTGLENAATTVQGAASNQAQLGQSLLPYLQAVQSGAAGVQGAAGQGAQMSQAGVGLAGQNVSAVNQLGQALSQQFGIPMQQAGQLLNLLTAGTTPGLQLAQATAPVATTSSKGMNVL
jgi:hypothetical protein